MSVLSEIEQAIAERLAPLRAAGIFTRALPNQPQEWGQAVDNGVITLKWEKDEFDRPDSMGVLTQAVDQVWKLDIRLKSLRDVTGGWIVLEEITRLLLGFQPPHCQKMRLRSREFLGEFEGLWVFEMLAIAPTFVVELDQGDPVLSETPLRGVFVIDEYGGLEVGDFGNV